MRHRRLAIALAALASIAGKAVAEPAITPRPLHVVEQPGTPVTIGDGATIVSPRGDADAVAVASYLVDLARRTHGPRLVVGSAAPPHPAIRLIRRPGMANEGYTLDINGGGATIAASTRAGLLYGAVSLWQLMSAATDHRLPPLHIDDAPRFRWRGLLLDSTRHMQSPAMIARMIDWMALHKLNRLQWHLADDQGWRFAVPGWPKLASVAAWRSTPPAAGLVPGHYGGIYDRATIRRLVALAAARGVTIVPEIEMPGHATAAILAYPEVGLTTLTRANLADWGVFPSIYGVGRPTFAMLHAALDELMRLFPSKEIAIGGDEAVHTLWHRSPEAQAKLHALGLKDEDALQGWFVGRIGGYLAAHGRRLVGWDEILADKSLAAGDIVLSWHGADGAIAAARAGHDVVMATAPTLYLDNRQSTAPAEPPGRGTVVSLADIYAYDPGNPPHPAGTPAMDAAAAAHVLGVQGQLWTEHISTDARAEAMLLPRAAAIAEIGWTAADRRDLAGFMARLPAMMTRYRALGLNADEAWQTADAKGSLAATTRRVSQQLDGCANKVPLNLAGREAAAGGPGPVYLIDILEPCWLYRDADLAGVGHIAAGIAALPFNYQFANDPAPPAVEPMAPAPTLIVHRGDCSGPEIARVSLAGHPADGTQSGIVAEIAPQTGRVDLCLQLARPTADPIWALGWVELRP